MTWYRLILIHCDHDGCAADYLAEHHEEGMAATRLRAAEAGWRVWTGRDFCPEHAPPGIPAPRRRPAIRGELTDQDSPAARPARTRVEKRKEQQ